MNNSKNFTPTVRFIQAAGSNTYKQAWCNSNYFGGHKINIFSKFSQKRILKKDWEVTNTEELIDTIHYLFDKGRNYSCMRWVDTYMRSPQTGIQIFEKFKEEDKIKAGEGILKVIGTKFRDQGIIAWDYCRICNIAGWGYVCGYITYNQAIRFSVDACKLLQKNFISWDNMMENYFLGLAYWSASWHYAWEDNHSYVNRRRGWYEEAKKQPDSLYDIPWNTVLDYFDR